MVAVTVCPQLVDSVRRVRAAPGAARGAGGRVGRLRRVLVPVLEDALERSLALAAGMDTRGYGRPRGAARRPSAASPGRCCSAACAASASGPTPLLDATAPRWLAVPMLLAGVAVAVVGLAAGRPPGPPHPLPARPLAAGGGARRRCPVAAAAVPWCGGPAARRARRRTPASSRCRSVSLTALVARAARPAARGGGPAAAPRRRPGPGGRAHDRAPRHPRHLRRRDRARPRRRRPDPRRGRAGAWSSGRTGVGKSTLLGVLNGLVPHFTGGHPHRRRAWSTGASILDLPPARARRTSVGVRRPGPARRVRHRHRRGGAGLRDGAARRRRRTPCAGGSRRPSTCSASPTSAHRDLRTLSGGQQQRVAIGSVLTIHPRVLVLDEPTSALDPTAAEDVLATLTRLVHDLGLTVLLAEHRLERVVPFADRIALLTGDGGLRWTSPRGSLATSPVAPPIVELGRAAGWSPLPLQRPRRPAPRPRRCATAGRPGRGAAHRRPRSCSTPAASPSRHGHQVAVRDVDVDAARRARHRADGPQRLGQVVAALGPPGRGHQRRSGSVAVEGADPARLDADRRRAHVGLVPQTAADLLYLETVDGGVRGQADREPPPRRRAPAGPCSTGSRRASTRGTTRATSPRASGSPWCWRSCCPRARACCCSTSRPGASTTPPSAQLAAIVRDLADDGHAVLVATHDVEFVASVADRGGRPRRGGGRLRGPHPAGGGRVAVVRPAGRPRSSARPGCASTRSSRRLAARS